MIGDAIRDVALERARQLAEEGFGPEHDDAHERGEMAMAASAYCESAARPHLFKIEPGLAYTIPFRWPWSRQWWKPTGPRRDLVKAAALIIAEIERIDRKEGKS